MKTFDNLRELAKLVRYYILTSTTAAGSGHASSALSAVELGVTLFFKYLRADLDNFENPHNDRFILSKGHASPLLYSLYAAAGKITETELMKLRKFESNLEGHPTMRFPLVETPTGSLGQGLSVGIGEALALRQQQVEPMIYVLLGDGEIAEGQVWEAAEIAAHYKLNHLVALIDVNRLEQTQQTMHGHDLHAYARKLSAFGWRTYVVEDGHDVELLDKAYSLVTEQSVASDKPAAIIARTVKGKGTTIFEDKNGWHGIALKSNQLESALVELGEVNKNIRGTVALTSSSSPKKETFPTHSGTSFTEYKIGEQVATRKAYGTGLVRLTKMYPAVVAMDSGVRNSTYADLMAKELPEKYFEMFIAEQNMVSTAVGMARRGLVPFVSSFSCFLMRAADQIRLASLSSQHMIFCGSHGGVSIGEDGPSQMGLQELSYFRTLLDSVVLYPADAVATERLVSEAYLAQGLIFIQTTRPTTPVIYSFSDKFPIGGSKVFKSQITNHNAPKEISIIAAGICVHEALKAQKELENVDIPVRVIDCYSIKPIDIVTLRKAASETKAIITVEDHYAEGGLGDAVLEALAEINHPPVYKLAVRKMPRSGTTEELLDFEGISAKSIIDKVK